MEFTQTADSIKDEVSSNGELMKQYIRFRVALIELGKEGNSFTAELFNEQLAFKENGQPIAYIPIRTLLLQMQKEAQSKYKR